MITKIKIINSPFVYVVRMLKICFNKCQAYNTVLLTIVSMLYIGILELTHFITATLCPLTNISPLLHIPPTLTPSPGNHHFTLFYYLFIFLIYLLDSTYDERSYSTCLSSIQLILFTIMSSGFVILSQMAGFSSFYG